MLESEVAQNRFEYVKITGILKNEQTNCLLFDMNQQDYNQLFNQEISTITQNKDFEYGEKFGWNWHKSKNLPEITYQLNMKLDTLLNNWRSGKLSVEIFVAKKGKEPSTFLSLGLIGNTELVLVSQSVTFRALKFRSTSYKHEHSKFQLVLLLVYNSDGCSQVLDSNVSPELYVDSRNKINSNLSEKAELIIDPFIPGVIDKKMFKLESRKKKSNFIVIENSLEGFVNYYKAQNIKFKIKHPLFIFMKFSQCVRLFLNLNDNQFNSITLWIQNELKNQEGPHQKIILLIDTECEDSQLKKKAIQICQQLENIYYQIYTKQDNIRKDLYEITNTSQLKMDYQLNYKLLQNSALQESQSKIYKLVKCSTKTKSIIQNNNYSNQDQQSVKLENINGAESEQKLNQNMNSDEQQQKSNHINDVMMNHSRKQEELQKYNYNNWNIYNNFYLNQNNIVYRY